LLVSGCSLLVKKKKISFSARFAFNQQPATSNQ